MFISGGKTYLQAQRHLLGGIEQLIAEHVDTLLPKSAHIIKALYDNDVIEEEVLLAWGEKVSVFFWWEGGGGG